jgi:4-hydroxy-tetrahydrodipicolinate synthase
MSANTFRGSICALITPFSATGIDFLALERLIEHQIAGGTDALVIAGSTGESVALEVDEFSALLSASVKLAQGRITIIAGTGTPSTARSVELAQRAFDAGAAGALVVTPAYCRPTQEGLYRHYQTLADVSPVPILLYNVPARTAVDLTPDTVAKLCTHPQICGVKEALPDMARVAQLLAHQSENFVVLSGDDATAAAAIALGARGLISVAANALPRQMAALVATARSGGDTTQQLATLMPLFDALGLESNPIPIKWLMHHMQLCGPALRLPLTELRPEFHAALRHALSFSGDALAVQRQLQGQAA